MHVHPFIIAPKHSLTNIPVAAGVTLTEKCDRYKATLCSILAILKTNTPSIWPMVLSTMFVTGRRNYGGLNSTSWLNVIHPLKRRKESPLPNWISAPLFLIYALGGGPTVSAVGRPYSFCCSALHPQYFHTMSTIPPSPPTADPPYFTL